MSSVHIYTAPSQPATRFVDRNSGRAHWFRYPSRHLFRCHKCGRKRQAGNLQVQVFYDSVRFWCAPGHGCKKGDTRR